MSTSPKSSHNETTENPSTNAKPNSTPCHYFSQPPTSCTPLPLSVHPPSVPSSPAPAQFDLIKDLTVLFHKIFAALKNTKASTPALSQVASAQTRLIEKNVQEMLRQCSFVLNNKKMSSILIQNHHAVAPIGQQIVGRATFLWTEAITALALPATSSILVVDR